MLSQVDQTALIALGFLGSVLAITLGLFGWMMAQGRKEQKKRP
ncbi:MAG: hypothetical protein FD124_1545 [Alphaproteobacteria bacterium]|nr:MAG: hypothetical protein FD160_3329 [Caulobacteraceae bacterium]TPW06797.1 MAG: hypothetical protein FD124_1545 [Alphaproteobacteria bacterium]